MNAEEAKRIVADQKELVEEKLASNYIKRDTGDISRFLTVPNVLAILGVRRSGKSTLSLMLVKELNVKFAYLNFDDENLYGLIAKDLKLVEQAIYEVYSSDVGYLIFDEVHNVKGWELFISRLRETKRVIITGSNSKMLSGELATSLTGRHSDFILFPFSFREYLRFKRVSEETPISTRRIAEVNVELERYMEVGGFPEALMIGRDQIDVIYNDILFKDVAFRYKVRELEKFKDFSKSLISYYSSEVSLSKLAKVIGVDKKTVDLWSFGVENAYLVYFLPRYGEKPRERLTYNKKVYVVDPGVISRVALRAKDKGRVMENLVALKLLRDNQLKGLHYVKGKDFEVDFYDEVNSRLLQVTYSSDKVEEREFKALLKAEEMLRARELVVVTYDIEGEEEREGRKIKLIPLYKFLLS
ncbi:MAG: ATP-binding protein [Metallosphaera yellowstonensis]|jgi:predicted AAA+ superfamily ATPase|uniref:Putative ATPase (AAA+ superfamily) n=1 Tax=Metallosphaera yellowstonensis MK1 TaxID=671065 RepID=H2C2C0_9CREN|nr:ATP-binding protein [Metallosphaera yellowstonensis]EHP70391.1 putative ATPase (AAA+ superfamily) [Metallosphaera yellowstonensis MK1]